MFKVGFFAFLGALAWTATALAQQLALPDNRDSVRYVLIADDIGGINHVSEFIRAANHGVPEDQQPQFIVFGTEQTARQLRSLSSRNKIHVVSDVPPWHWQQDYIQPYIDLQTGDPVIRPISGYIRANRTIPGLMAQSNERSFRFEVPLNRGRPAHGGHYGGNIMALPGPICLIGTDNFRSVEELQNYQADVCPPDHYRLIGPSHFTRVGHIDEVMHLIPTNDPKPCDFAIGISNSQKMIELLREAPDKKFWDFQKLSRKDHASRIENFQMYTQLCMRIEQQMLEQEKAAEPSTPSHGSKIGQFISGIFRPNQQFDCSQISNSDFVNFYLNDEVLHPYNTQIDQEIELFKNNLSRFYNNLLPECTIRFVDVPQIFYGRPLFMSNGQLLTLGSQGHSILPNPANSVFINSNAIFPDPGNDVIRDYIRNTYTELGNRAHFVDSFSSHQNNGNLHCATNLLRTRSSK